MPRTARIAPNEYVYHILTRGNNRQDIFKDKKDYKGTKRNISLSFTIVFLLQI
jgi:REP element-mobilizing transposase RayT